MTDALAELSAAGVAVWLDDISRERLRSGNLAQLVRDKHVVGVTTNPTIFQKALSQGDAYDEQLRDLALRGVDVGEAVRTITTYDVRWGCDVLRPVYDGSDGVDGRVSIEVDPRIAHDTDRTVAEAKALWWLVDRPNLFIKIPATLEGLPAITETLGRGHQRQRDADLLPGPLRPGDGRVPGRPGAGPGQRARPGRSSARSRRSSSPASTPRSTSGWTRSAPRRPRRCAARPRSPTPGWPTSATRRSSAATGGRRWRRPGRSRSGRCGRRPGSRTRRTTTRCTSSSWSRPGVVNTMPEATLEAVADHGADPRRHHPAVLRRGAAGARPAGRARHRLRRRRADARGRGRREVRGLLERADRAGRPRRWRRRAEVTPAGATKPAGEGPAAAAAKAPLDELAPLSGSGRSPRRCGAGRRAASEDVARRLAAKDPTLWGPDAEPEAEHPARLARPADDLAGAAPPAHRAARRQLAADGLDHVVLGRHGRLVARAGGDHPHAPASTLTVLDTTDPHQVGAALGRTGAGPRRWWWSAPRAAAPWRPTATGGRTSRPSAAAGVTEDEIGRRIVVVTDPGSPLEADRQRSRLP